MQVFLYEYEFVITLSSRETWKLYLAFITYSAMLHRRNWRGGELRDTESLPFVLHIVSFLRTLYCIFSAGG